MPRGHTDLDAPAHVRIALLALSVTVIGCAATGNVATSPDGTFTAVRRGNAFTDSTSLLRLRAEQDANEYCAARGRKVNVIRSTEIPAVGHWPEADVSFTCD